MSRSLWEGLVRRDVAVAGRTVSDEVVRPVARVRQMRMQVALGPGEGGEILGIGDLGDRGGDVDSSLVDVAYWRVQHALRMHALASLLSVLRQRLPPGIASINTT